MRAVGIATTVVVALIAVGMVVVAAISTPDIKRYLRIRQM